MRGLDALPDPLAQKRVQEASSILRELGFDAPRRNLRSSLTLLAFAGISPNTPWANAFANELGITETMGYFNDHYGKSYKPNSRESVRRETVHQFIDGGILHVNADDPLRPTNSGITRYRLTKPIVALLQTYGTPSWKGALTRWLADRNTLVEQYAQRRDLARIAVQLPNGEELRLSPGGQNPLVKAIIEEFLPRFAPGSRVLCAGDTADKWAHLDEQGFADISVNFDTHGKFPDVVALDVVRNWLLLVEAVTSHGPVDVKRHGELSRLFDGCTAGLVYVTTFMTRSDFTKYLSDIAWETEVWIADSPGHMIHFNGSRFLGPYNQV